MIVFQPQETDKIVSSSKKRRLRRKKLQKVFNTCDKPNINSSHNKSLQILKTHNIKVLNTLETQLSNTLETQVSNTLEAQVSNTLETQVSIAHLESNEHNGSIKIETLPNMSSKDTAEPREKVLAAREAKKLAKQAKKNKESGQIDQKPEINKDVKGDCSEPSKEIAHKLQEKSKDEVDRAAVKVEGIEGSKTKEQILAERAAKKAVKQSKKKPIGEEVAPNPEMTVKDVVETLRDIKIVAKDVQDFTAKVSAIHLDIKKTPEDKSTGVESGKSKAELRAERRAIQEAHRAAKQAIANEKAAKSKTDTAKPKIEAKIENIVKEKSPKPKLDKTKVKVAGTRTNWLQHLNTEHNKDALKKVAVNSNLHPAIVKLGVQLASRVIEGANARCIALLNALKQMIRDYTLPAKTEFARGLEAQLAISLQWLWSMRQPSASQTNAIQYFRHQLTQLPNNVEEFIAKKTLQEEIDKYIEDQIDKAGEAISMAVRKKISNGDRILTYGCSSLIERILREAWSAGVVFHTVVVGDAGHAGAREMLRRLAARGLPVSYGDITALGFLMRTVALTLLGAEALLANGAVLGGAGAAAAALAARARNVPVLVACETHKVSASVITDGFLYNEIGDPDALIDNFDDNSPLKDWRSNPNLTPINLTYDVTPPSLVTAVVTEKAILPCTSAPVVLRTKLSEYGI